MPENAIIDTSSLIALEKINLTDILCKIYTELFIPEAVIDEFGIPSFNCYSKKKVTSPLVKVLVEDLNLGKGEAEVIALANETGLKAIIDDLKARSIAEKFMLKITGTIGILLKAESLGMLESAYIKAIELKEKGFYVSEKLLKDIGKYSDKKK